MKTKVISTALRDKFPDNTQLAPPPEPYLRDGSLHISLPGVDDPEERVDGDTAKSLVNAVIDALDENSSISNIEVLVWPGERALHVVLTPTVGSEQPETRNDDVPVGQRAAGELNVTGRLKSARDTLADTLQASLPGQYGIETCAVDLTALGRTPIPTSRLVLKQDHSHVARNQRSYNPFVETIRRLSDLDTPFVLQTIVEANSGGGAPFISTVRLAVMDPRQIATKNTDYLDIASDGRAFDLADMYGQTSVSSNFSLDAADFQTRSWGEPVLRQLKWATWSDTRELWRLWEGSLEWWNLLAGRTNGYDAYESHVGYARMPVTDAALRQFLAVPPMYYEDDPWADVPGRNPPRILTLEEVRATVGTDLDTGITLDDYVQNTSTVVNTGGSTHRDLLALVKQVLEEEGAHVRIIEQDTASKPDGIITTPAGEKLHLEADVGDVGKPANIGSNIARALKYDREVVIVVRDKDDAERVHAFVRQPFKGKHGDGGVELYNRSKAIPMRDGSQPVLPADVTKATWVLDGRSLSLLADGVEVAAGQADETVMDYAYETPRLVEGDDGYRIVSPEGEILDSGQRKAAVMKRWTKITIPHVPGKLHYLNDVTIRFRKGTGLSTYETNPVWWSTRENYTDGLGGGIRHFLNTWTTDSGETRYDRFREMAGDYMTAARGLDDPEAIEEFIPDPSRFGIAAPDHLEKKHRDVDGSQKAFLRDRSLVYEPGIIDPDLPFITNDEAEDDNEAGESNEPPDATDDEDDESGSSTTTEEDT